MSEEQRKNNDDKKETKMSTVVVIIATILAFQYMIISRKDPGTMFLLLFGVIFFATIIFIVFKKHEFDEKRDAFTNAETDLVRARAAAIEKARKRKYEKKYYVPPEPKPTGYANFKVVYEPVKESNRSEALKNTIDSIKVEKKIDKNKDNKEKEKEIKPIIVKEGESKAEKEGNVTINSEGKPVVKPNYKIIASEWVRDNLDLLNKICNDACSISGGDSSYSALIPAGCLPEEKATWLLIGKTLEAEDDISSFRVLKDGLEVTVD